MGPRRIASAHCCPAGPGAAPSRPAASAPAELPAPADRDGTGKANLRVSKISKVLPEKSNLAAPPGPPLENPVSSDSPAFLLCPPKGCGLLQAGPSALHLTWELPLLAVKESEPDLNSNPESCHVPKGAACFDLFTTKHENEETVSTPRAIKKLCKECW
ncbi:hypothetical protein MUG91_G16n50 [Manis pentadactyla]|nr:hypothetical protein MUG91_G16n50 [Manis pentadactyla]